MVLKHFKLGGHLPSPLSTHTHTQCPPRLKKFRTIISEICLNYLAIVLFSSPSAPYVCTRALLFLFLPAYTVDIGNAVFTVDGTLPSDSALLNHGPRMMLRGMVTLSQQDVKMGS